MQAKRNEGGSQGRHFSAAESMQVEVKCSCSMRLMATDTPVWSYKVN